MLYFTHLRFDLSEVLCVLWKTLSWTRSAALPYPNIWGWKCVASTDYCYLNKAGVQGIWGTELQLVAVDVRTKTNKIVPPPLLHSANPRYSRLIWRLLLTSIYFIVITYALPMWGFLYKNCSSVDLPTGGFRKKTNSVNSITYSGVLSLTAESTRRWSWMKRCVFFLDNTRNVQPVPSRNFV